MCVLLYVRAFENAVNALQLCARVAQRDLRGMGKAFSVPCAIACAPIVMCYTVSVCWTWRMNGLWAN